MSASLPEKQPWHALDAEECITQFATSRDGLADDEARQRLESVGYNRLPPPQSRSALRRFADQFRNILIYVLLGAALVTALLGHWADTGVIIAVVFINALVGFLQEGKAEKALDAIRDMLSHQATVYRDGRQQTLDAEELVPGDIVQIQSGDRVPADIRLFKNSNLQIDESTLTGESVPVEKRTDKVDENSAIGDRVGVAHSGTLVTYGQGRGVVVATGTDTELGHISTLLSSVDPLTTPLLRQIDRFGQSLTSWIVGLAAITFLFGHYVRDYSMEEMFLAAVGLAVAAIPEGLPAIITIVLAIGVQRMAQRHAIIRRLPAVEALGAVSVIGSDKTGTLTHNEMTVVSAITADGHYQISGSGYDPHGAFTLDDQPLDGSLADHELSGQHPVLAELCRAALLCNDGTIKQVEDRWTAVGDPTEAALITLATKAGFNESLIQKEYPRVDSIPFESQHRFMATLNHDHAGHPFILVKGAPERILSMCTQQRVGGDEKALNLDAWQQHVEELAAQGERVLAIAMTTPEEEKSSLHFADVEEGLILLGLVGLIDPPRDEAIKAVRECQEAGIRVKMITGDHAITARAIAAQMGIGDGRKVLTGPELDAMDDDALTDVVADTDIFARASPEDKLRLVAALQRRGEVVVMTGDGVNDAPALRRADVGVAMGINGTEVAKESAEMVLADDNFASIAHAVVEGRTVYDNIRKSIVFILPTNGGEALTIMAAILFGVMLPITPLQILWVNMITAVTLALALAFEQAEEDVMKRPPRPPSEPLLNRFLVSRILLVSVVLVIGTFGLFLWYRQSGIDIDTARTVAVNTLVMGEVFYLLNTRFLIAPTLSLEAIFGNRYIIIAIVLVSLFQILFTYVPFMQALFATRALGLEAWLHILMVGIAVFVIVELEKGIRRRLSKQ